ncbi:hypothetical protein N7510_003226 [Penicillium lagena]|uniref:uncharacterized protein n=1 Tax=Penicillium lagena TaxID=94218 RepID=UPI00253FE0AA|nr:uncharacterized protein N7510_003226 [Penicillium lagena]KAJ5619242.1 hypothetical protein N7510_003226 [Penicillium lagena]
MPLPSMVRLGLGLTIGLSAATTLHLHPQSPFRAAPMQCQYTASSSRPDSQTNPDNSWAIHANDPILQKQGRPQTTNQSSTFMSARTMRQVSLGSVLGLVAGVGLRAFSKVLVVVLGMGIVLVEWAASKGYNILPINRLQKYVKNVDLRHAMSANRPFKMSFGTVMALAAFAQF